MPSGNTHPSPAPRRHRPSPSAAARKKGRHPPAPDLPDRARRGSEVKGPAKRGREAIDRPLRSEGRARRMRGPRKVELASALGLCRVSGCCLLVLGASALIARRREEGLEGRSRRAPLLPWVVAKAAACDLMRGPCGTWWSRIASTRGSTRSIRTPTGRPTGTPQAGSFRTRSPDLFGLGLVILTFPQQSLLSRRLPLLPDSPVPSLPPSLRLPIEAAASVSLRGQPGSR